MQEPSRQNSCEAEDKTNDVAAMAKSLKVIANVKRWRFISIFFYLHLFLYLYFIFQFMYVTSWFDLQEKAKKLRKQKFAENINPEEYIAASGEKPSKKKKSKWSYSDIDLLKLCIVPLFFRCAVTVHCMILKDYFTNTWDYESWVLILTESILDWTFASCWIRIKRRNIVKEKNCSLRGENLSLSNLSTRF